MTLLLLGPDGQDIHRNECDCLGVLADDEQPCPLEVCDGSGLVRVPGCGCAKCEAERAREGCEVRP